MSQKTATEKDMFLQTFEQECKTTLKLLRAFPAERGEYKPHEKSGSARQLAWTFVLEQGLASMAIDGTIDFKKGMPEAPATFAEIIPAFEKAAAGTAAKIAAASEEDLNKTVQFPVGPGKMGDLRRFDVVWSSLMDQVHHRGQLSVYLRLVGAKVPSIYGPSADEPWM